MDKHQIRRQIMEGIECFEPAPAEMSDMVTYPYLKGYVAGAGVEKLLADIQGMIEHGYVENLRPGREPLLRLTAKGRDQLRQEADLEEYIWGGMASRFQR